MTAKEWGKGDWTIEAWPKLLADLAAAEALCVEISKMRDEQMVRGDSFKERAEKAEKKIAALEEIQQNVIDGAMDDLSEQLVSMTTRAEKAEAERDRLRGQLDTMAHDHETASREVSELRDELEALKPYAIGGDGSTHWYWKDEAERLAKELKKFYGLEYEERKGRE